MNIYLPDDLHELAQAHRKQINLSAICARALREELEAQDSDRTFETLNLSVEARSEREMLIKENLGLADAIVVDRIETEANVRARLGEATASYLDCNLIDGSALAFGGGRQMWSVVRNLSPRRIRLKLAALGVAQADPQILHVHPNTLATVLWLKYSPRAETLLVGADGFAAMIDGIMAAPEGDSPQHFLLASCGRYSGEMSLAKLIDESAHVQLVAKHATADFAYAFLDADGATIDMARLCNTQSILSADQLRKLSSRTDVRVMLVAGGVEKSSVIRQVVEAGLCNMLITDTLTAEVLEA